MHGHGSRDPIYTTYLTFVTQAYSISSLCRICSEALALQPHRYKFVRVTRRLLGYIRSTEVCPIP